jgi:hypothetical protein
MSITEVKQEVKTERGTQRPVFIVPSSDLIPPLPKAAVANADLARQAAPWLDEYIKYSRKWSPRSHDGYHEATGLWTLSTVAARRLAIPYGGMRYTNLYIALVGVTSVWRKTSAAKVGIKVLGAAGLNFFLCPDEMTPQAFIQYLSTVPTPNNFFELPEKEAEWYKNKAAFAGQQGWYYDEFGQKISAMMRDGGHMADYRGLLRVFDDGRDKYIYVSRGHGTETVNKPYLSLMANITPADLKPYAGTGSALWNDGFWARFAFVSPGEDDQLKTDRWPNEIQTVPSSLTNPLVQWHKRLGVPHVAVIDPNDEDTDDKRKKKQSLRVEVSDTEPIVMGLPTEVFDLAYTYQDALDSIIKSNAVPDLNGNYSRFGEKAIRIAALLASVAGYKEIQPMHWHRAQEITERWRVDLHSLYRQLGGEVEVSRSRKVEDAICRQLTKRGPLSVRDIKKFANLGGDEVSVAVSSLLEDGTLMEMADGKTKVYILVQGGAS